MGQGAAKREIDKGTRLYGEQKFDAAINEWKSALRRMTKKEKLPDKFNTLNYLCMAYFDTGKYREVITCANQQLEMLNSKTMCNNADFMQEAYFNLARGYEKLSEFKKSISYAKGCIEKEQNNENAKDIMSFATICLAKAYHGLSDFYNAINNFDSVLNKTENCPSLHMRFLVFESLGQLFSKLKDYDTAHLYYDRCLDIILQDAVTLAKYKRRIQCQIALPMLHMGRFNDAMEQCELSMKDAMLRADRPVQARCLFTFAEIHRKRKDFERSFPRYESAYALFVEMGDRLNQVEVLGGMAKCMAALKDFEQAIEINHKANQLAEEIGNKIGILDCNIRLAELYILTGNSFAAHQCEESLSRLTAELELFCGVCGESIGQIPEHLDKLQCGHLIHSKCTPHLARYTWGRKGRKRPCPSCRNRSSGNPVLSR